MGSRQEGVLEDFEGKFQLEKKPIAKTRLCDDLCSWEHD